METLLSFASQNPSLQPISDSRYVDENSIFFAIVGTQSDGHDYLADVISKNVAAIVLQEAHYSKAQMEGFAGKCFVVKNSRQAWAAIWKHKSEFADDKLFILGVTGTNGKTSMAHMAEHILNTAQKPCAVMGTINHHLKDQIWPTTMTTPGADILYPRLQEFLTAGAEACAMEISSHGLDQNRVEGLNLDAAVFSNLTNDHLDYHKDLEDYFLAKEKLFTHLLTQSNKKKKVAVINLMDAWGRKIILSPKYKTYYLYENSHNTPEHQQIIEFIEIQKKKYKVVGCEVEIIKSDQFGNEICLTIEGQKIEFQLPTVGKFQAYNWAEVVLSLWDYIDDPQVFVAAAKTFAGIPGRLQKVLSTIGNQNVFVDYAHTPDALQRSLESLRQITTGQIVVAFGCGGDRDKAKRPLMASIAQRCANHVIVTNDNPRTEDPQSIAEDILKGFEDYEPEVILDRRQAILKGIMLLKNPEDVLLIAGKGHEDYQIIGNQKNHFSDYETAYEILQKGES